MTKRTWVYNELSSEPIVDFVGGETDPRIFAKKSMTSNVEEHPFLVYKFGNNTDQAFSEEVSIETQFIQVWVHDYTDSDNADYMRIDEVIDAIKTRFRNASSPEEGIIRVEYLETSQDLNDETLNTVMKYIRFQMIQKE